jgi:16S rRNA (guanine1207-N2)-methyltransferase
MRIKLTVSYDGSRYFGFQHQNDVLNIEDIILAAIKKIDSRIIDEFSKIKGKLKGKVLDLGCGIGTVGLVLKSLLFDLEVEMVDVQHNAVELAKENIKRLKLEGIKAYESDVVESVTTSFNYVLTNPPIRAGKATVHQFFDGAYKVLENDGVLLVVIRKSHGAPSAKVYLENLFGNCEILKRNKGFYILKSVKTANK